VAYECDRQTDGRTERSPFAIERSEDRAKKLANGISI